MENIKKSVLILVLVNSFLYGADWSKLLYSSAAMEESNLEHSLNLGDLKQSKNWWVPSLTFNGAYYTGGDFSSQTVNNSLDSILKISQNIPGGLVLWGKVQVPLFVGEDWAKNLFPSIGVNIPVIPSLRGAKLYNSFINNQYTDYKNGADLDYKISLKKKAVIFSEYVWKVLYNRKKTELLNEELNLLKSVEKDFLILFEKGRVNLVELEEQASNTKEVFSEIVEARSALVQAQKQLIEYGFKIDENDFEIEDFVSWLKDFSSLFVEYEDLTYRRELCYLRLNYFKSVSSRISNFPIFQSAFNWNYEIWNLNLSLEFKLFPDFFDISEIKSIKQEEQLYQMRRKNLEKSRESFSKLWKVQKDLNNSNIDLIQAEVEMEENRLNAYQELYKCGRVNEITVKIQQNKLLQVRLLFQNAQVELYKGYLSFY